MNVFLTYLAYLLFEEAGFLHLKPQALDLGCVRPHDCRMACGKWYTAHGMLWEDRQTLIPEGLVSKLVLSPHISQSEGTCLSEPSFPYS